jgi:uncharacterized protein YrrD
MKLKTITAVSALALMVAMPVYATHSYASNKPVTMEGFKRAVSETGADIKAFFVGSNDEAGLAPVAIQHNMTAKGLVGQDVVNEKGEKVATVKDIIIGANGKAILLVVADNGFLGIGKKVAAFDYNRIVTQRYDGDVVMVMSQDMIKRAADFSYDQKDWAKSKVAPEGSVSTNLLLGGDVLDHTGEKMASIENVYFRNAAVTQIIVGFHKTLGIGGDTVSFDYDNLKMVQKDDKIHFQLTPNQSAHFKRYQESIAN